jgi:hypothetical protein
MRFGHEKLDVYQLSVDYVAWAYTVVKDLGGVDRHVRDQWLRASQSTALTKRCKIVFTPLRRLAAPGWSRQTAAYLDMPTSAASFHDQPGSTILAPFGQDYYAPLSNIAEGNGEGTNADRRRYFEIARGSALECAAIQDCLAACGVISAIQSEKGKGMLIRIVSMLTKLGRREHELREDALSYGDYDNDNDNEIGLADE